MSTPRPGPTSSTTSSGLELGEPADHAEQVLVDQEVLAELLLRGGPAHASPKAALALASSCAASSAASSPRASASAATVWTTFAGSFGRPRLGCGARYGLSVSASSRSRRDGARGLAQLLGLRVGDVAGEREVVAALERDRQELGRREAVQDDGARERLSAAAVSSEAARVWTTTGLPSSAASSSCALEELALAVVRRVVAVEVEPGLADGDRALVGEQLTQLVEPGRVGLGRLVRVDAERGEDAVVPSAIASVSRQRVDTRADRDDPVDAGLACARDQLVRRLRARVEVRVGVDHAAAVGWSTRGKSGAAAAIPSVSGVRP